MTAVGPQQQELVKGRYKVLPNHVRTRDGIDHSYAPVDVTPAEMQRLVEEMRSELFLSAHPVMQAAYAHYALVVIHPFPDGNGRVARALASAFTYRAISMPIMILSDQKNAYPDSLEAADQGHFQQFVDFIFRSSIETITVLIESLRSAQVPSTAVSLAAINGAAARSGRFSGQQIDAGGSALLTAISSAIQREVSSVASGNVQGRAGLAPGGNRSYLQSHRPSQNVGQHLYIEQMSIQPSRSPEVSLPPVVVKQEYDLFVPLDASESAEFLLKDREGNDEFSIPLEGVLPAMSGAVQMRIDLFAKRVVAELLDRLRSEVDRANQRVR